MNRLKTTLILTVALILGFTAAIPTGASSDLGLERDLDLLGNMQTDTPNDGLALATSQSQECEGDAPVIAYCTTGPHVIFQGGASHGFPANQGSFNGTVESRIITLYPAGAADRVFRCDYEEGDLLGCQSSGGSTPSGLSVFLHVCSSYDLQTTNTGGTGSWKCFLNY